MVQTSLKHVIVEDWGRGIKNIEMFVEFGQYSKADLDGEIIGSKGLGKLSLLRLGDKVNYRTNNGDYSLSIMMSLLDFDYDIGGQTKYLEHRGTKIIIQDPRDVPPTDKLGSYLERAFGLRIAQGRQIILNGSLLGSKIDPNEKLLCRLGGAVDVTGNLKGDKKAHGNVDVYVKHVFVQQVPVDPERNFGGWVNCNRLVPDTNRNSLVHDRTYDQFLEHLKEYVTSKFPRREDDISKEEKLIGNEIANLLKKYLDHAGLIPKGLLPVGRGTENVSDLNPPLGERQTEAPEQKETESEYEKQHTSKKTDKPIKRVVKSTYGIRYVDQDAGNDKEPLFYVEPNLIIKNRTNDLYKFVLRGKESLGPKWFKMLPYLSRVAVNINPASKTWTHEQFNLETDRVMRFFLKAKDVLSAE